MKFGAASTHYQQLIALQSHKAIVDVGASEGPGVQGTVGHFPDFREEAVEAIDLELTEWQLF